MVGSTFCDSNMEGTEAKMGADHLGQGAVCIYRVSQGTVCIYRVSQGTVCIYQPFHRGPIRGSL